MAEPKQSMLTPKGRCAFVSLLQAKSFDGGDPKFSTVLIFDKAAQATKEYAIMKAAAEKCAAEKWPNGLPPKFNSPFRSSEEKAHVGFPPDCVFITISTALKPGVVGPDGVDIFESSKLYSGMYGRASLTVYPYDKGGNRGVAFGMNNFQKLSEGEAFTSRASAAHDFGPVNAADAQVDIDAILNA